MFYIVGVFNIVIMNGYKEIKSLDSAAKQIGLVYSWSAVACSSVPLIAFVHCKVRRRGSRGSNASCIRIADYIVRS